MANVILYPRFYCYQKYQFAAIVYSSKNILELWILDYKISSKTSFQRYFSTYINGCILIFYIRIILLNS